MNLKENVVKFLTTEAAQKVVHTLISSKLDYGNSLFTKYNTERLQRLQNTAARIVSKIKKYDDITSTLRKLH